RIGGSARKDIGRSIARGRANLRGKPEEGSKSAATNPIESHSVADDVVAPNLTAVILDLMVGLKSLLLIKIVRPSLEKWTYSADFEKRIRNRVKGAGELRRIADYVVELQIAKADRVGKGSRIEIETN